MGLFKKNRKQKIFQTYRKMFPEMIYEGFDYEVRPDGLHMVFHFVLNGLRDGKIAFAPTACVEAREFLHFDQPKELLDRLVFNIGMIELVSYWKCVCPPKVTVRCGSLNDTQVAFWKKIYFNGLGEFFYTNGIQTDAMDFMQIESSGEQRSEPLSVQLRDSYIVPIGGGKDSAVTLSLLGSAKVEERPLPLIMNPRGATIGTVQTAGYAMDEVIVIRRTIDPVLLDLNAKGCLNGHTPFSAMLGFYTMLAAVLSGRRNVALSNECSANESTVFGTSVNHQYSKSLEFENDFRFYVAEHIAPELNYFSFLRPIYEIEIANLFARRCQAQWQVFRSCNKGSKEDVWCGHCAKCLFVYIIMAPFVESTERLVEIFGHDLLDDASLRQEFDQLTGHAETKPFECVGTVEEVDAALAMLISRRGWKSPEEMPRLLKNYSALPYDHDLFRCQGEHNLSENELALLKNACVSVNLSLL